MSFIATVFRNRTRSFDVTITDVDGVNVTIDAGDVVRVKIGRGNNVVPDLDLDSAVDSANGSSVTAANPTTVNIAQGDTSGLTPGAYDAEVSVVDDSDSDFIKGAEQGVLYLREAMAGDIAMS